MFSSFAIAVTLSLLRMQSRCARLRRRAHRFHGPEQRVEGNVSVPTLFEHLSLDMDLLLKQYRKAKKIELRMRIGRKASSFEPVLALLNTRIEEDALDGTLQMLDGELKVVRRAPEKSVKYDVPLQTIERGLGNLIAVREAKRKAEEADRKVQEAEKQKQKLLKHNAKFPCLPSSRKVEAARPCLPDSQRLMTLRANIGIDGGFVEVPLPKTRQDLLELKKDWYVAHKDEIMRLWEQRRNARNYSDLPDEEEYRNANGMSLNFHDEVQGSDAIELLVEGNVKQRSHKALIKFLSRTTCSMPGGEMVAWLVSYLNRLDFTKITLEDDSRIGCGLADSDSHSEQELPLRIVYMLREDSPIDGMSFYEQFGGFSHVNSNYQDSKNVLNMPMSSFDFLILCMDKGPRFNGKDIIDAIKLDSDPLDKDQTVFRWLKKSNMLLKSNLNILNDSSAASVNKSTQLALEQARINSRNACFRIGHVAAAFWRAKLLGYDEDLKKCVSEVPGMTEIEKEQFIPRLEIFSSPYKAMLFERVFRK